MKIRIFKSSGKWYETINICNPSIDINKDLCSVLSVILINNSKYEPINPINRTIDSWFAMFEEPYPYIIWLR